jgi:hypothetical protein
MILKTYRNLERRAFLRGIGGTIMALPLLETFNMRGAQAAVPAKKINVCFIGQMDGHVSDMFYPPVGPITTASLKAADAAAPTATAELADHAADLGIVRNIDFAFGTHPGCGHPRGGNISITASAAKGSQPGTTPSRESADWPIAQLAGKEPLNLYAGRKGGGDDCFAFGVGGKVRVANNKPYDVYLSMMGLIGMQTTDPGLVARLAARDKSINDVLRSQIQDLMRRTDLSMSDRDRLQTHFASIRELEVGMTGSTPQMPGAPDAKTLGDMALSLKNTPDANDMREAAVKMQLSLIALAFSAGMTTAATLQIGQLQDDVQYIVDGKRMTMGYHSVTHAENGDSGEAGRNMAMVTIHHKVDRIHAQFMKHMIEQLKLYKTIDGRPLLDDSVVVWTNQMGNGYSHEGVCVPWVYAGSAGGALKTGISLDAGHKVKNSQILNSVLTACGVRKPDGSNKDDFGDPTAPKGLYADIMKA